jgi:hypothetical protein
VEHAAPITADPSCLDRHREMKRPAAPLHATGPKFAPPNKRLKRGKTVSIVSKSNRRVDDLTALFVDGLNGVKPVPRRIRTMGDLLNTIALGLEADNWTVEAEDVDTQGMTVVDARNGLTYRLEMIADGILDDAEWQRRSDAQVARELARANREYADFLRAEDKRRNADEDAADARNAFLGHDAAGFNGQETEIDF